MKNNYAKEKDISLCDECGSKYFKSKSKMVELCPECAHILYGKENCNHVFKDGKCIVCFWDGSRSDYIKSLLNKPKNKYLKNLNKIEFVVTYACTGRCKHCSEGDHALCGERIDPEIAAEAVKKIAAEYDIKTVMTFGGEPLLHTDAVYAIMTAAKALNIEKRQVITNGYFSKNAEKISAVAQKLSECGVNDLLLSVDAFHQETIPLDVVKRFAAEVKKCGIPIRLSPAWLVSPTNDNPYNKKTREILDSFSAMMFPVSEGNVIFPEGNARKYLAEYFTDALPENPYIEDPRDVRCVSFSPDGGVLDGNVYRNDIMEIIRNYEP